ncbi:MAG: IPTL-CTERM sorting domain-containing protein [Thermoanaerobaculia bacterium]
MRPCRIPSLPRSRVLHAGKLPKRRGGLPLFLFAFILQLGLAFAGAHRAGAATVDLVVNIVSDQPAYMSFDLEHFTVTISNNGPDPATNVALAVNHPLADIPFEASATCQPVPGPNPNGPAVCPAGSGTAPSPSFTRMGTMLLVTIPSIPSQSQVMVQFDNRARCPAANGSPGQETRCHGEPAGNYPVTATVSAAEAEALGSTNTATTNIFLYPPVIEYKVAITSFPATAAPGTIADYDFEVRSTGDRPSDKLKLLATIQGQTGTMLPLTATNNPNGASGSTLPNTILQSIDCLSTVLGTFPPGSVFPSTPAPWQACPTTGLIPIPVSSSGTNTSPITGFPGIDFLDNLPGILDAPPTGGVMRFRAHVLVGDPVCVGAGDTGNRNLVFTFSITGLPETKTGATPADNTATVITQVPGTCKVADVQFTTSGAPPTFSLNGSGVGTWTHTVTVTNLSSGGSAGTATNVPVTFEHHQFAFTETQGPLTCTSVPSSLCPPLTGGIGNTGGFSFATTIASLPPLATVTFSQQVTETRTACWFAGTSVPINLSGHADPSPAVFDPVYDSTTPPQPVDFTPGINTFFGNNGQQTIVTVTGLTQCPGGGSGPPPGIAIVKSGPFASAADATAGTPLIGQTSGTFLPDATQVWYKVVVTNTNSTVPLLLGNVSDTNFFLSGVNATPPSGFTHTGTALANWGITCIASPVTQTCHELATTAIPSGYNNQLTLSYNPALHGGNTQVGLAPLATLTYLIPFTTPTHTNKCQPVTLTSNTVSAAFVDAVGGSGFAGPSSVNQYIGTPPCIPGVLSLQKVILAPATPSSIPPSGLITYAVTLTNTSATATLDIPHFVDTPAAPGVTLSVVGISCTVLSGGAQCPPTPVTAGIKVPAVGSPTPLPDPFDIDHEWGFVGNNTFPPNSAVKFTITLQLSNPTRDFTFIRNTATFSGENDHNGWTPASQTVFIVPPPIPELSLQKKVSTQIAAPSTLVTYTVIVSNIGAAAANNAVFTDALPAALLATNPSGYVNVTCTDITAQPFVPSPKGVVVCPSITSNASGLSATIATFGPNTALKFTYQALMPSTPVSIDNVASVTAPSVSGVLSFGAGTAQSRENVQVIAAPAVPIPTLSEWALLLLAALLALSGIAVARRSRHGGRSDRSRRGGLFL